MMNNMKLNSTEKVLYKCTVEFHMKHESMTEEQAAVKAMEKILATRALCKKTTFRY
jgi:hypothetical protein